MVFDRIFPEVWIKHKGLKGLKNPRLFLIFADFGHQDVAPDTKAQLAVSNF